MSADYDTAYAEWKKWHSAGAFTCRRKDAKYFRGQFAHVAVRGARVLEIGFGNGQFLAWARDQGAVVCGTELLGHSVRLGREQGLDVYEGRVDEITALQDVRFDLVVLIDVLEHLADEDLARTLDWIVAHLHEDGRCVARVPNAASPFGLMIQHGDLTHLQSLSLDKFRQLSHRHGFEIVSCVNQYRSWAGGLPALRQSLQRGMRRAAEACLRFMLELRQAPLDMNIVLTFKPRPGRNITSQ